MNRLQIFKAGSYVASNGKSYSFSEADLAATARAYDPAKSEAPLVIGHPTHNAPAYGWVKGLSLAAGALEADPHQVDPAFAEMVASGRFKKRSASFYAPDAPENPVPGIYYLRHVGFLGAQPPAVKGLREASFAGADAGVISFADWDDVQNASLWRSVREWIIAKFGMDEADKAVPGYVVDSLQVAAAQEPEDASASGMAAMMGSPSYSEQPKGVTVTPEQIAAREAELDRKAEEQRQRDVAFSEREKRLQAEEKARERAAIVSFVEAQVSAGRILPAEKAAVVELMCALGAQVTIEFGEGEQKTKQPAAECLKKFIEALPARVEFGERGRPGAEAAAVEFAAPSGYTVDGEGLELHGKALAYQKKHDVDYVTAVKAVGGQ